MRVETNQDWGGDPTIEIFITDTVQCVIYHQGKDWEDELWFKYDRHGFTEISYEGDYEDFYSWINQHPSDPREWDEETLCEFKLRFL